MLICVPITALSGNFIDTVYSFRPGTVQFTGQSKEYFPMNIFGPPAANATRFIPASAPDDVLSIGINGEIIVGIKAGKIFNGFGYDFIVFENAFERNFDGVIFAEPAIVSVSQNGIDFVEFPYNDWTLDALAGKTPTIGSEDPFNNLLAGGDAFDIGELGFDYITHIKLRDVSQIVSKSTDHPFYQPEFMITGFDLDAIAILYPNSFASTYYPQFEQYYSINNFTERIVLNSCQIMNIKIYNSLGSLISSIQNQTFLSINKNALPTGLIIISIEVNGYVFIEKLVNCN